MSSILYGNKKILLERVEDLLEQENELSIAINGDWGIGKSFFLEELKNRLGEEHCIFVDTWELDRLNDLTSMIAFQVACDNIEDSAHFNEKLYNFGIDVGFLKKIAIVIDEVHLSGKVNKILDRLKEQKKITNEIDKLLLLENLYEKGIKYIFIDELDRTYPEKALSIIKDLVYLNSIENIPRFIVSTNLTELSAMIKHIHGESYDSFAYFDKIFDVIIEIRASLEQKFVYMAEILQSRGFVEYTKMVIDSKDQMNIVTIINKMSFRKLKYLTDDIKYYKIHFSQNNYSQTNDKSELMTKKTTFILDILSLKYINYSHYSELLDENINFDRYSELLRMNLIKYNNLDNDEQISYHKFRELIRDMLLSQQIYLY